MSRASSSYVSPNLGPTAPWGQQTSTGVFRPPPTMTLNPSTTETARHDPRIPARGYPVGGGADSTSEHGLAPNTLPTPPYPLGSSFSHGRPGDSGGRVVPSPPMPSNSPPPTYSQNHYNTVPNSFALAGAHSVAVVGGVDSGAGGGGGNYPADRIMKMISYTVHREEDTLLARKESNRVLEKELLRVQEQRRETQRQLETVDETLQTLQGIRDGQVAQAAKLGIKF